MSCGVGIARIRDHPYMQLHLRMLEHLRAGRTEAAGTLRRDLEKLIQESSMVEPEKHHKA
jgi:hypothetical protein